MNAILENHFRHLSHVYPITLSRDQQWATFRGFRLPRGFNRGYISILLKCPPDYPRTPPGINRDLFVPGGLQYQGRPLVHLHPNVSPGWGDWGWYCFHRIAWDMHRDNLLTFLDMFRTELTRPATR